MYMSRGFFHLVLVSLYGFHAFLVLGSLVVFVTAGLERYWFLAYYETVLLPYRDVGFATVSAFVYAGVNLLAPVVFVFVYVIGDRFSAPTGTMTEDVEGGKALFPSASPAGSPLFRHVATKTAANQESPVPRWLLEDRAKGRTTPPSSLTTAPAIEREAGSSSHSPPRLSARQRKWLEKLAKLGRPVPVPFTSPLSSITGHSSRISAPGVGGPGPLSPSRRATVAATESGAAAAASPLPRSSSESTETSSRSGSGHTTLVAESLESMTRAPISSSTCGAPTRRPGTAASPSSSPLLGSQDRRHIELTENASECGPRKVSTKTTALVDHPLAPEAKTVPTAREAEVLPMPTFEESPAAAQMAPEWVEQSRPLFPRLHASGDEWMREAPTVVLAPPPRFTAHVLYFLVAMTAVVGNFMYGFTAALRTFMTEYGSEMSLGEGWNVMFQMGMVTPLVDDTLCRLQLNRRCSGGVTQCTEPWFDNVSTAHARYCPFCKPSDQMKIAQLTRTCPEVFNIPENVFGSVYLILMAFNAACLIGGACFTAIANSCLNLRLHLSYEENIALHSAETATVFRQPLRQERLPRAAPSTHSDSHSTSLHMLAEVVGTSPPPLRTRVGQTSRTDFRRTQRSWDEAEVLLGTSSLELAVGVGARQVPHVTERPFVQNTTARGRNVLRPPPSSNRHPVDHFARLTV